MAQPPHPSLVPLLVSAPIKMRVADAPERTNS